MLTRRAALSLPWALPLLAPALAGAQVLVTGWAGGPGPRHDPRAVGRSAFWLVVAAAGLVVGGFLAS